MAAVGEWQLYSDHTGHHGTMVGVLPGEQATTAEKAVKVWNSSDLRRERDRRVKKISASVRTVPLSGEAVRAVQVRKLKPVKRVKKNA